MSEELKAEREYMGDEIGWVDVHCKDEEQAKSAELKACPFCGSTDLATESFGERRHCVVCEKCECSTGYMLDDDEAIEAWNTRPLEDALRAEIAQLQEELNVYHQAEIEARYQAELDARYYSLPREE